MLPLSKKLGMIEWINNTVTLKDFICESFPGGKESGKKQLLVLYNMNYEKLQLSYYYYYYYYL